MLENKVQIRSNTYAESIINTIREPLIVLDQNLRVVAVSRSFYEFFKVKPEDTIGELIYNLGNKQWDIPRLRELLETILPQKTTFQDYEVEHDFATIGRRIMLLNARQIEQASGKELIILLAIEDITERKAVEEGLEKTRKELEVIKKTADEASEFTESIINTIREPLLILDQNLRVVAVSRSFYEFFKVKPEDTIGELIYNLGNKQWDIPRLRELLETILPQKTTFQDYEVEHDFATIGRRIMLLNARQIEQASGKELIILLAIEDITERKKSEEKINTMAYHDHLTGLPNRALFFDRLGQAMSLVSRTQKLMAVLMLDLDRFKPINDELGHAWGDKVLIEVSKRLQQCTRSTDTVARLGGDEFSIILVDVNSEEHACKIAEDIITAIREPLTLKESQYTLGVSIGICMVTSEDNNIKDIMRKADTAMYQGKKKGGSYVIMH